MKHCRIAPFTYVVQQIRLTGIQVVRAQILEFKAQQDRCVWLNVAVPDEGFRICDRQGKTIIGIFEAQRIINTLRAGDVISGAAEQ